MGDPLTAVEREAAITAAVGVVGIASQDIWWLLDRIGAVRALHFPYGIAVRSCSECEALWPCPTIKALDGAK